MRVGYACINTSINCTSSSTFRLKNYSKERFMETVKSNLECLKKILEFNNKKGIKFFRITSQLIPFASHPVCSIKWQQFFSEDFKKIGEYVKKNHMRITMHPDPFIVLNSPRKEVVNKSLKELKYHSQLLESMHLSSENKIVIHVGGVYGDKNASIKRFVKNYNKLGKMLKKRLVIENDDSSYSLMDCLKISDLTGVPVVLDVLHHEILNNNECLKESFQKAAKTWKIKDGKPIIHYNEQKKTGRKGYHSETVNVTRFNKIIKPLIKEDFDVMLEVKDKEKSALKILKKTFLISQLIINNYEKGCINRSKCISCTYGISRDYRNN
ncbi:MAG: UV DNA damage repair endonuclease UvsE [Nanoarchaeota archaeon]|nr:UV DNA damage repair endonuclease UvsE [Nanoarchaeota archaeon]